MLRVSLSIDILRSWVLNGSRDILVWELWEGFLYIYIMNFGGTGELKS